MEYWGQKPDNQCNVKLEPEVFLRVWEEPDVFIIPDDEVQLQKSMNNPLKTNDYESRETIPDVKVQAPKLDDQMTGPSSPKRRRVGCALKSSGPNSAVIRQKSQRYKSYISNMVNSKELSDVVIIGKNREFHAHRIILSASSPALEVMLRPKVSNTGFLKRNRSVMETKELRLLEFGDDIIYDALSFIYTAKLPEFKSIDDAVEIFKLSCKWDICGLKDFSVDYISFNLSVTNALDILILADISDHEELKSRAVKFLKKYPKSASDSQKLSAIVRQRPGLLQCILEFKPKRTLFVNSRDDSSSEMANPQKSAAGSWGTCNIL